MTPSASEQKSLIAWHPLRWYWLRVTLSLELPDSIARLLHLDGPECQRRALEMVALEGYRSGDISRRQVGELLGLDFFATEQFLKEHHAIIELSMEEFRESSEAFEGLLRK